MINVAARGCLRFQVYKNLYWCIIETPRGLLAVFFVVDAAGGRRPRQRQSNVRLKSILYQKTDKIFKASSFHYIKLNVDI